mgnify:CR=1
MKRHQLSAKLYDENIELAFFKKL